MKITLKKVKETLQTVLGNRASGIYTIAELQKIREDEKMRDELARQVAREMSGNIRDREDFKNATWWEKLRMLVVYALSDNSGEVHIPEDVLRDLARMLLPDIIRMYESEEGRKQLEEWKAEQDRKKKSPDPESKRDGG